MNKKLQKQLKKYHFGLHVTFDGYGCNEKVLDSIHASTRYLNMLVKRLHMKKLYGPKVVYTKGNGHKDPGGNSGFVIIEESHLSIHTFPKRRFVSIDMYSCNDFDHKEAVAFTKKYFTAKSIEKYIVVRGKKYPMENII